MTTPRYTVKTSLFRSYIYDNATGTLLGAMEADDEVRTVCDLLNKGEQTRTLARAVKALGDEDGPYTLTNVGSGVWHVVVDDGFAEEWGCPLADALIDLAKKTTMMEAQS